LNIKLVAMDMDDTVLNDKQELTPRTLRALKAAMDQGVHVVFVSGRIYSAMAPYARQAGLNTPLICCQGAMIKSPEGEIIEHTPVPMELAREVINIAYEQQVHAQYYFDSDYFYDHENEEAQYYAAVARIPGKAVGDLRVHMQVEPTKILYISPPERIRELDAYCRERFAGKLEVAISKARYLEFTNPAVSKGRALASLSARLGVRQEEVMALGDSFNDLSMLRWAGVSVAMGNSDERIKAECTLTTGAHTEDGVAQAIEQYVLK